MSQSDLSIANVSRSSFRQEVNEALQALGSLSSGATEPTTTYAYQLWADTASGVLKQRNAANDGWINKGNLDDVDWGLLNKAGGTMTGLLNLAAGADIASAATVDLTAATGNCPKITGTTAVEAWTMNTGQQMKCIADGALPLTYDATTNNIEGGASYTCAAGDIINLVKGLDGVVRVRIEKQDGTSVVQSEWVYGTNTATTSGGSVDILTGMPSWATEIELMFTAVSLTGTDNILVQLGTSGGYVTTGYASISGFITSTVTGVAPSTSGFVIRNNNNTHNYSGVVRISKGDGNVWFADVSIRNSADVAIYASGRVSLSDVLTQVRVSTAGVNGFDSGSIIARYR